jgi:hypothetical protein
MNGKPSTLNKVRFEAPAADALLHDEATQKKSNRPRNIHGSKRRNKFMFDGLRQELRDLQRENETLKMIVREKIQPIEVAQMVLKVAEAEPVDIFLTSSILMDEADEFREKSEDTTTPPPPMKKSRSPGRRRRTNNNTSPEEEEKKDGKKFDRQRGNPIPRFISMRSIDDDDYKPKKKLSVFHEEVDNLADALSGNFAF